MAYALQAGKRAIGLLIGITATLAISVAFVGRVIDVRPFVIDCLCVTVAEYGMSTPTGDLPCLTPNCLPPRVHLVRPRTGRLCPAISGTSQKIANRRNRVAISFSKMLMTNW